jgi:hypothetical protein
MCHPKVRKKKKKESFVCKTTNKDNTPLLFLASLHKRWPGRVEKKKQPTLASLPRLLVAGKKATRRIAGPMWM